MRTLVVGGGIAGLSSALSIAAVGHDVVVAERSEVFAEIGAGLQLSPNAMQIIEGMGLKDAVCALAGFPEAVRLRRAADLKPIASVPLGRFAEKRWGQPYLVLHRADLHRVLLDSCRASGTIQIEAATEITSVDLAFGHPVVFDQSGRDRHADLVVAADGVWSTLRRGPASNFTGLVAWRRTIGRDNWSIPVSPEDVNAFLDPRFHMVTYPLRGGSEINLVVIANGRNLPPAWNLRADGATLATAIKGSASQLLQLVEPPDAWTIWPLHEMPPIGAWTDGRGFALVGDAAHAMTPLTAQGAAMALEDAAVLGQAISRGGELGSALVAYQAARRPRIARVARRGRLNRLAWHASGPVALARDLILSLRGPEALASDLDWLYGWRPDEP